MIHILRWEWWGNSHKWVLRITWGVNGVVEIEDLI